MPDDTHVGPNHELPGRSRSDAREIAHVLMRFQPGGRSKLVFIGILSLVSGLSEAAVIALVSATAVATAQKDPTVNISVVSLSPPTTLVVALGLILAGLAATSLMANVFSKVTSNAAYEARREIVDVFHRASYQRKSRDRLAGLQEVLTTYVDRLGSAFSALIMFISAVLSTLSFAIAAVVVSPFAALLIGVIGGLLAAVLQPATRLTRRASRSLAEQRQHYADGATESVLLARELSVFGVAHVAGERLRKVDVGVAHQYRITRFLLTIAPRIYQTLALSSAVVGLLVLTQVEVGNLAAVGAVVLLLVRSLSYAQNILTGMQSLSEHRAYVDRLMQFLESYAASQSPRGSKDVGSLTSIELDETGFSYESNSQALAGVNLTVRAGETIGIVGPSGAGKSTFVNILLRLYTPTEGSIRVNGIPLAEISNAEWHRRTAIVPQEPRLLHGSLADNIRFLREIDDNSVEAAARDANIEGFIRSLPDGFDSPVGELGMGLSGGQRQRICIARALAGKPDLLVLDEPTSALDGDSETAIQRTLESLKGGVTMVLVAHRLSTLSICDRLVVMKDGRIENVGTPEELLGSSEYYREALRLAGISGRSEL